MTLDKYTEKKKAMIERGELHHESTDEEAMTPQNRRIHEEATKVKTIDQVVFGKYRADTWYYSPFPEKYHGAKCLYFCEYCLNFFLEEDEQERHQMICTLVTPPGDQIYLDDDGRAVFEVDPVKNPIYIENLGFLAKMYLDHKLLMTPLNWFLFYVLTEVDDTGHHFVGYFSKNRDMNDINNLSCILVLPFFQKKGYGKFLINFSYELAKKENFVGTPERPLSDFGRQAYLAYWLQRMIDYFRSLPPDELGELSLQRISKETYIAEADVIKSLEKVKILKRVGDSIYLCLDKEHLDKLYKEAGYPAPPVDAKKLRWVPYRRKYELEKIKL
jgi:GNAT superfamily N-acetyltransferase